MALKNPLVGAVPSERGGARAGLRGWGEAGGRAAVLRRVGGWRLASGVVSAKLSRANPGRGTWTRAPRAGPEFRGRSITTSKDRGKEEKRKAKGPNRTGLWARGLSFKTTQRRENGRDRDSLGRGQRLQFYRLPGCRVSYRYLFIQESGNRASWTSMKLQPK